MQRLVLQSVLAAASALFILSATACDKGGEEKKTDNKVEKTDDKAGEKAEVEPPAEGGEPAGTTTTTTTGAVEPPAETDGGEPAAEGGAAEAGAEGGAVAPDGDSGKAEDPKAGDTKTGDSKTEDTKTEDKEPVAKIDAKALFEGKCKSCHGSDGKGDTTIGKKVNIPSLAGTKLSKADATKKIRDGVPDTKMKGYADKLSKEEIDALAAYVKKL
jgi:mono/diheme cytochrome c family protein